MILKVNGYNINYVDEGEGDVVLLLHGWGANYKSFTPLIELLKTKYRVLAIDYPGFGESSELDRSFTVDDYADIVASFLISLDIKKVILVGHSYGERIIIKLNSRKNLGFAIEKNVLIDAAGLKDHKDLKTIVKIKTFKALKKIANVLPIDEERKKELERELKLKFGSSDYSKASKVMQETLVKAVNEDLTDLLKNMKETLLIWGDSDTVTPMWMAKKMESDIENAGLVVLHGGHFSYLDDPITFMKVISSYFKL